MRILLATDGSANSLLAAKLLANWKTTESLDVNVLAVANVGLAQGPAELDFGNDVVKSIEAQAKNAAAITADVLKQAGVNVQAQVVNGHPASSIVEKAKDLKSELIVIGAQGHSLMQRVVLGSVSDFVATHASCSVLVVRDTNFLDQNRPLRVCIGYDDSEPSKQAIKELSKSGWAKDAQVDIVSIASLPVEGFGDIPIQIDSKEIMEAYQALVDKAVEMAKPSAPNAKGHVQRGNNVGMMLADFAEKQKSDITIVGDTGRGLVARFFLGSVSRSVLRHTPSSVWIVRKS